MGKRRGRKAPRSKERISLTHPLLQHQLRFYGDVVELFYAASVDGHRMSIPYPKLPEMTITRKQYKIGAILNTSNIGYDYDTYLERAKITVKD